MSISYCKLKPDNNKIHVFNAGIPKGLKGKTIPAGGQNSTNLKSWC
jgi:hypothetical protein